MASIEKTQETSAFKNQLFTDVYNGIIPKRVPVKLGVNAAAALELAGYDLRYAQYGITKVIDATDKINAQYDTDTIIGTWPGQPYLSKIIGSRTHVMGDDGFMQHPNVNGMEDNEYDQLIADPLKFIWETVIPRVFTEFAKPVPHNALVMAKAMNVCGVTGAAFGRANAEISAKYNKVTIPLMSGISRAPFDYFADYLRSFTGAMIDIKRYPDKVLQAIDVITPLMIKSGCPRNVPANNMSRIFFALHMPTFMRVKDFEKFWWPSFKETVWAVHNAGFGVNIFCEENWMRTLDYLDELPPLCELQFEYGDPKVIKEKVGKKHIIQGLFPVNALKTETADTVRDKAKELMDILAPGGNFMFNTEKSILRARQINWDNFAALIDVVKEYGVY